MESNKKNVIVEQTEKFAQLCSGRQKAFYERMLSDLEEVKISPLSEVFTKDEIEEIRRCVAPKKKECYKNAFELAKLFHDSVDYIEGYTTCFEGTLPIEHAFNRVRVKKGYVYVDVTMEMALGEKPWEGKETYMKMASYTVYECLDVMYETGVYGGMYYHTFFQDN